jgi:hypothetical protein
MSKIYTGRQKWHGDQQFILYEVRNRAGGDTNRVLYTAIVMDIYDHESDLSRGRFEYFSREAQEYSVKVKATIQGWRAPDASVQQYVNWIAEHTQDSWSMEPYFNHVHDVDMTFSFADITTATMFKLVFG